MITDGFLDRRITHAHNDTGSGCPVPKFIVHSGSTETIGMSHISPESDDAVRGFRRYNAYANWNSAALLCFQGCEDLPRLLTNHQA